MQTICNEKCFCSAKVFEPICGPDGSTNYFSPCFAGCKPESLFPVNNKTNVKSNDVIIIFKFYI